jgi:7-cyano-7-deazaguanine synthase in queuosine biosynthesis
MGKRVLLFSGGTDSFVLSKILNPDIHLYFDIGTAEVSKELEACKKLGIEPIVDKRLFLQDMELPNKIVPMRNLFFILMACYYGDVIYLGATKGDMTRDDTEEFRDILNALLLSMYQIPEKNPRGRHLPRVEFPVKHLTKTEIIKEYLKSNFSLEELKMTRSCYKADDLKDCGHCISCFRKWISYVNNNIYLKEDFLYNPLDKVEEFRPIVKTLNGEYGDLLVALEKVGYKNG